MIRHVGRVCLGHRSCMDRLWIAGGSWYGSFLGLAWGMDHRVWIVGYGSRCISRYGSRVWIVVWIALWNPCIIHTRSFWLAATSAHIVAWVCTQAGGFPKRDKQHLIAMLHRNMLHTIHVQALKTLGASGVAQCLHSHSTGTNMNHSESQLCEWRSVQL